jgi:hypothetical protein
MNDLVVRGYPQTGYQCRDQKSRVIPPQMMGQKDLIANSILCMLMRTAISKTVQCVQIGKSRVGIMKLFIIMQHAPGNLVFIIEFVLGYTTRR